MHLPFHVTLCHRSDLLLALDSRRSAVFQALEGCNCSCNCRRMRWFIPVCTTTFSSKDGIHIKSLLPLKMDIRQTDTQALWH